MSLNGIFCVDLTKYNYEQLSKISDIIGIVDGALQQSKREGVRKSYFDHFNRLFVGEVVSDPTGYSRHYKNLILTPEFGHLTKKEKDNLIKMEPYKFNTKKNGKNPFFEQQNEEEAIVQEVQEVKETGKFTIDSILDKISQYGIESLTKSEKKFLDEESKK